MAVAYVTFTCYYPYEVEIDDDLYEKDPEVAEKQAIEDAYEMYRTYRCRPFADISYDTVEVEFE